MYHAYVAGKLDSVSMMGSVGNVQSAQLNSNFFNSHFSPYSKFSVNTNTKKDTQNIGKFVSPPNLKDIFRVLLLRITRGRLYVDLDDIEVHRFLSSGLQSEIGHCRKSLLRVKQVVSNGN